MELLHTSLLASALVLAIGASAPTPAHAVDALELVNATLGQASDLAALPRQPVTLKRPPFVHDHYIGETEFYVPRDENGNFKSYDSHAESLRETLEVMHSLAPSHLVFNGAVGALTGQNALTSKAGEKVLFVHSQANRDSRPHLIGGHGDYVRGEGKFANAPLKDLETWLVRGGSAAAALYTFRHLLAASSQGWRLR